MTPKKIVPWIQSDFAAVHQYKKTLSELSAAGELPIGSWRAGEIEILSDSLLIREASETMRERLIMRQQERGQKIDAQQIRRWTQPGIVYDDPYLQIIRFAVAFPAHQGTSTPILGLYITALWGGVQCSDPGVCVVPMTTEGKLVLVRTYRHAVRGWRFEFPRGTFIPPSEHAHRASVLDTVRAEVREEAGYDVVASSLTSLGAMEAQTGLIGQRTPVYFVRVEREGIAEPEYGEAISGSIELTPIELMDAIHKGYHEHPVQGGLMQTSIYGSFESYGLLALQRHALI
ncbi:NUDIX hydrolase [Patescibacteria group bacterium]|nr:NUDIX hydrolase [Patescibacteria group bacterium]